MFYTYLFYVSSYFFLSKLLNRRDQDSAHNIFLPNVAKITKDHFVSLNYGNKRVFLKQTIRLYLHSCLPYQPCLWQLIDLIVGASE